MRGERERKLLSLSSHFFPSLSLFSSPSPLSCTRACVRKGGGKISLFLSSFPSPFSSSLSFLSLSLLPPSLSRDGISVARIGKKRDFSLSHLSPFLLPSLISFRELPSRRKFPSEIPLSLPSLLLLFPSSSSLPRQKFSVAEERREEFLLPLHDSPRTTPSAKREK